MIARYCCRSRGGRYFSLSSPDLRINSASKIERFTDTNLLIFSQDQTDMFDLSR